KNLAACSKTEPMPKSEGRSLEGRRKAETRSPKDSQFGFRTSFGFRPSDFGLCGDFCDGLYLSGNIRRFRLLQTPLPKGFVLKDSFGEQLIALRQRMTGIGIQGAWQSLGYYVRNVVLDQPGRDAVAQFAITRPILFGHHMLIKRPQHHKDIVSPFAQG